MKTARLFRWWWAAALVLAVAALGCEPDTPEKTDKTPPSTNKPEQTLKADTKPAQAPPKKEPEKSDQAPPKTEPGKPAADGKKLLGPNVWFEKKGDERRVIISATVCLREGPLEQLLTTKKVHEAILTADVDARHIHAALLLAGARSGSTVRFQPKYVPATGQSIKVTLQYEDNGKLKSIPAQEWVRNSKTRKELNVDWIFAGSQLLENPIDPKAPPIYLANDGDVICVSNFEGALLDLPINSPKENSDLNFEAATERIPPKGTKVAIILEPIPEKKK
jgi:hypothetical protein